MDIEKRWQRFRWKTYGRWSKVHVRERGYYYSLCGIARFAELQETEHSVTCRTCMRVAQARNLVGWND